MNDMITFDTEKMSGCRVYDPFNFIPETDLILKTPCVDFDFTTDDPTELSERLKATLVKSKALGVAAPQCGISVNVFCMGAEGNYTTLFNPKILYKSEETMIMEEGCLSFPFLVLSVIRPKEIRIKYQDENANWNELTLDGLSARVAQHEYDHLFGVTFDELAKPLALKMGKKKREKNIKYYAKQFAAQKVLREKIQ